VSEVLSRPVAYAPACLRPPLVTRTDVVLFVQSEGLVPPLRCVFRSIPSTIGFESGNYLMGAPSGDGSRVCLSGESVGRSEDNHASFRGYLGEGRYASACCSWKPAVCRKRGKPEGPDGRLQHGLYRVRVRIEGGLGLAGRLLTAALPRSRRPRGTVRELALVTLGRCHHDILERNSFPESDIVVTEWKERRT
jgi:hypothetical protein